MSDKIKDSYRQTRNIYDDVLTRSKWWSRLYMNVFWGGIDDNEIAAKGQIVKNITSKFLSDDLFDGEPFCQRRAKDFLSECVNCKGAYYLTTFIPLIHARVGAFMDIRLNKNSEFKKVRIDELTFRYKKEEAFSSEIWVTKV